MSKVGKSLLLDSSIIIAGFKRDKEVLDTLYSANSLYVPVIAYGELYTGALKSQNSEKKLRQLAEFMDATAILDVDWRTAQHYGQIRKELEQKGRPVPENDIWIAALSFQYSLKLYARDQHFEEIEAIDLLC